MAMNATRLKQNPWFILVFLCEYNNGYLRFLKIIGDNLNAILPFVDVSGAEKDFD